MSIYERFGKLIVEKEIIDNQLQEVRKLIQKEINDRQKAKNLKAQEPNKKEVKPNE